MIDQIWWSQQVLVNSCFLSGVQDQAYLIIPTVIYPLFFFLYLSLGGGCLLTGTSSSGGLGLILSTSVLINGYKEFDFRHLYSLKFPRQPHCRRNSHFRRRFIMAHWTTLWLTQPNWFILITEPTNQRTVKKGQPGVKSCHITGYFRWFFF